MRWGRVHVASHILLLKLHCGSVGTCILGSLHILHIGYKYTSVSVYLISSISTQWKKWFKHFEFYKA